MVWKLRKSHCSMLLFTFTFNERIVFSGQWSSHPITTFGFNKCSASSSSVHRISFLQQTLSPIASSWKTIELPNHQLHGRKWPCWPGWEKKNAITWAISAQVETECESGNRFCFHIYLLYIGVYSTHAFMNFFNGEFWIFLNFESLWIFSVG